MTQVPNQSRHDGDEPRSHDLRRSRSDLEVQIAEYERELFAIEDAVSHSDDLQALVLVPLHSAIEQKMDALRRAQR